jgi:tripartite-type tricarboxylate transporter receptor subunit TctC
MGELNMNTHSKRFTLAMLALGLAQVAMAQPSLDPVDRALAQEKFTLVAPFPPGGPVDQLARLLADGLHKQYGQPAVVENLPGAAGNLGMEKVKRAKGDGHVLLVIPAGNLTINPSLMPKFPFVIERDFVPVTMLAQAPNVLVVHPGAGIASLKDLIAQARAKPGALSYASPGIGSGLHLAGELFKQVAGIDIQHVPYKGSPQALNDVAGGSIPLMFTNLPAAQEFIRRGRVLALGIPDKVRTPAAPDIPSFAELGVTGVQVTSWYAVMAPAGTPADVVERLAKLANSILSQPATRQLLQTAGLTPVQQTPAQFAAHLRQETAEWARIIKARGIVAE